MLDLAPSISSQLCWTSDGRSRACLTIEMIIQHRITWCSRSWLREQRLHEAGSNPFVVFCKCIWKGQDFYLKNKDCLKNDAHLSYGCGWNRSIHLGFTFFPRRDFNNGFTNVKHVFFPKCEECWREVVMLGQGTGKLIHFTTLIYSARKDHCIVLPIGFVAVVMFHK